MVRAAIVLLVDHPIHNFMRWLAVEIHRHYQTGFLGALLPPHVSLKQPFRVTDLAALTSYFDELAEGIAPFEIRLTQLELRSATFQNEEYGILWLSVEENRNLRDLHNRINRELAERFADTQAPFDGAQYHFHATVAIGGQPLQTYREIYNAYASAGGNFSFIARELALFYYDGIEPGTFITYRIRSLGKSKAVP